MGCIFCNIIEGKADASFIHKDDDVVAFMDIRPVSKGHLLVVPIQHGSSPEDLPEEIVTKTFETALRIARGVKTSELAPAGINLFLADGKAAGQEVFHLHVHVIPRYGDDGFHISADAWAEAPPDRAELGDTASIIQRAI
jgi:histidine triad (HIT) family protein